MCRIGGIVNKNFSKEELHLRINAMNTSQEHGGPDGNGVFIDSDLGLAIGHRRLALLDLSNAGSQPMFCNSKDYCISFNGEIYNYLEIKAQLLSKGYIFKTNTDTEVILNSFKEWGTQAFKKFNGMFAFSILDFRKRELFLVRDLIGMKPLYYFHQKDTLVFASEIKAFPESGLQFQDNSDWRPLFLSFGYIPEPFSTLKDVLQLKPGSYIKYDLNTGNIQEHEFERLEYTDDITDFTEAAFLLKQTLTQAVERHLIADTPVGVFLSGGLDSSILTLLASQSQKTKLKTLSINFDENAYNERNYQHLITSTIHSEHADFKISTTDYLNALPEIKNAFDQPTNDAINTWFISKYAKQEGLKACISGLGGDELFGGYPSFNRVNQLRALKNIPSKLFNVANHFPEGRLKKFAFLQNDSSINDYLFFRGFYTPKSISQLVNISEQEVNRILNKVPIRQIPENTHPKNYVSHLEQNLYMRSQLLKDTDVMGMAHGVEIRMPFLDKEVLKLVYSIRPDIKFKLKNKGILAKSFEDILPKKVISREKKGFTLPLQEWQKSNSELNTLKKHPNAKVRRIAINTLSGKSHWAKLWILTFLPDYLVKKSVLFLSLKTFSLMGGIERMNRVIMKAGHDIQGEGNIRFNSYCLHDSNADIDERYLPKSDFHAFEGN
ncbi:MAG TPA: asparagine synthase (glutamine-hydrolyzing), partial [Emticicia sp.]